MNVFDRNALAPILPKRRGFVFEPRVFALPPEEPAAAWRVWLARARDGMKRGWGWARARLAPGLLLIVWEVGRLSVVSAAKRGGAWQFSVEAASRQTEFGPALGEALERLRGAGIRVPRQCYVAAAFIVPARVDMPVDPDKPRPPLQMRELARAEMEPAVAEAGALWTIGAALAARGRLTAQQREQVVLALALRREQSNTPTYFGQVACELGFIAKEDVQEALRLQEKLQMLESALACGWAGHKGEAGGVGEAPRWLASATGLALWSQFERACKQHGLKLLGGLPLAWSVSEAIPPAAASAAEDAAADGWLDERRASRVALEIHGEEIVAVLRQHEHIVAARLEGRVERPLAADWLLRLVADWRASGVEALDIVCLTAADEAAITALGDEIPRLWGKAPRIVGAGEAHRGLLECLARQYRTRRQPLPLIRFGELPKPPWKRVGFWHAACPLLVIAIVTGVGIRQRMEIKAIQTRFDLADAQNARQATVRQQEAGVMQTAKREKQELERARTQLAQMMPEVERLQAIENMTSHLPQLLRTLARAISDDVVLEVVKNSKSGGGEIGDVMIVGWANHYGGAQSFAQRVQRELSGFGYAVAQTDVRAGKGRLGRPGYFVSFWLLPRAPAEELGLPEGEEKTLPAAPAASATPAMSTASDSAAAETATTEDTP
ncbi:MAG: hypothetical protein LBI92_03340 [Azoarcus sp.]|jgi:hypothetical protein|nr:hypothetical protein [Azoarcus sp.]